MAIPKPRYATDPFLAALSTAPRDVLADGRLTSALMNAAGVL